MRLADTITRQRGTTVSGPYGSTTELDWTTPTLATYQAEVMTPVSDEDVQNAQRVEATYVVQTYPGADITERDRVVWQAQTYEVVSAIEKLSMHGTVRSLKFLAKRVTGG